MKRHSELGFVYEVPLRWFDFDQNRHLGNIQYSNAATETRLAILRHHGLGLDFFERHTFGPVIAAERIQYVKEIAGGQRLWVTASIDTLCEDYSGGRFLHGLYSGSEGVEKMMLSASIEVDFFWFDLKARQVTAPPEQLLALMKTFPKTEDFSWVTKAELLSHRQRLPKHLDASF